MNERMQTSRVRFSREPGESFQRIRFGQESRDFAAQSECQDCGVVRGELHAPGCDIERCPKCGGQLRTCSCDRSHFRD